jgi:small nuclear ribonucleoprotein (snRNP)-like protein
MMAIRWLTLCPQPPGRTAKMQLYINYRMRVTLTDQRSLVGTLMAYDKHMNLVLGDCEEFRRVSWRAMCMRALVCVCVCVFARSQPVLTDP